MFTIANQTAFSSHSNSLLSENPQVPRTSDLLDETLHSMITFHRFSKRVSNEPIEEEFRSQNSGVRIKTLEDHQI